jgi:uncharacterized protein (DUF488 family)
MTQENETLPNIPTIYTIGHSNVPASKIIELLETFDIKILADVRSSPYSQFCPQFNREDFAQKLSQAGIEYKYAGDYLGGRPKDPTCYKDGQIPEGHADYLHLVDYPVVMTKDFFQKGIKRLTKIAEQECLAVMCSEEDPAICHRHHLIGRYLTQQGFTVLHIRGDGNTVKDQVLPNLIDEPPAEQLSLF